MNSIILTTAARLVTALMLLFSLYLLLRGHNEPGGGFVGGLVAASSGETNLFITPGYRFKVVDALITNFHLPRSTLLMLVSAFAGLEKIQHAYRVAIEERYRFFSYGDAMLITR